MKEAGARRSWSARGGGLGGGEVAESRVFERMPSRWLGWLVEVAIGGGVIGGWGIAFEVGERSAQLRAKAGVVFKAVAAVILLAGGSQRELGV